MDGSKSHFKGLYVLVGCLTVAFTLTFVLCYVEMNSLRSTINSLQTLKMIDLKGEQETVGHEDNKSEVEKVSRNKRGYSNYISVSQARGLLFVKLFTACSYKKIFTKRECVSLKQRPYWDWYKKYV